MSNYKFKAIDLHKTYDFKYVIKAKEKKIPLVVEIFFHHSLFFYFTHSVNKCQQGA